MSRVINTENIGTQRNRMCKGVVLSIRELMSQTKPDSKSRDLVAFIALSLEAIADTVEKTVIPWEKRDYWVKADRFRMEWAWAGKYAKLMRKAALDEDWPEIAMIAAQVGQQLSNVKVSPRHRMGTPWVGAWKKLTAQE
ncbi:MAG: hypothetical protein JXB38_16255 [Anaerolineales bacterium]|nr:hypothetical protein [Anaerolineales bacterium]